MQMFDHIHPLLLFPDCPPPSLSFFFLPQLRPVCAAQIPLDVWPSTGAWLTYQGYFLREK